MIRLKKNQVLMYRGDDGLWHEVHLVKNLSAKEKAAAKALHRKRLREFRQRTKGGPS